MKRLSVWELGKGLFVAAAGLALGSFVLGRTAGWSVPASLSLAAQLVGGLLTLAGVGGAGYALSQLSAGAELAGHNFGATVGAAVGAYEAARLAARGELPALAVEAATSTLPAAADRGNAPRAGSGPDGEDVVSRFQLTNALTNTVIRWHAGKKISRKAMEAEGVLDQRYWNLATRVCIEIGLRERNSSKWVTRGSEALDLIWVASRVKVISRNRVWVWPEGAATWQPVDLYGCHFLNPSDELAGADEDDVQTSGALAPA